jgi:hypothetical protein
MWPLEANGAWISLRGKKTGWIMAPHVIERARARGCRELALDRREDVLLRRFLVASSTRAFFLLLPARPSRSGRVLCGRSCRPAPPQAKPSNNSFHAGTDSISSTKWHVFWESSAKTGILPLYGATFSAGGLLLCSSVRSGGGVTDGAEFVSTSLQYGHKIKSGPH